MKNRFADCWLLQLVKNPLFICLLLILTQQAWSQSISISTNTGTKNLEIRNGNLGIILPPVGKTIGAKLLSPIQALIYKDGTVSDNTPNYMESDSKFSEMQVNIREQKPERVEVKLTYYFESKTYRWFKKETKMAVPNDKGYYSFAVIVEKGSKSIRIEEEGNCNVGHYTKVSNGLSPDRGRYRGWQSYDVATGYEPDGKIYRPEEARGYPLDATIELRYDKINIYPRMILWEPAGGENGSGRYWQFYSNRSSENANLFGIFQGPPSRLINAGGSVGPNLRLFPKDPTNGESNDAELQMGLDQQWPDDRWVRRKRFQWGIFISTKRDLHPEEKTQPIAREMNRVSGLGAVINKYASDPVKLTPAFYKGAIYTSPGDIEVLRNRIRNEKSFYDFIVRTEMLYKPVWDSWRFPDSAKSLLKQLLRVEAELIEQYTNGEGTFHNYTRYWKGARMFKVYAISVAGLMLNKEVTLTDKDKYKLQQLIGLMARIVWDDNNVPAFDSAGVNMGPANMLFQYRNNARVFFALLMANTTEFKTMTQQVVMMVQRDLDNAIYSNGASFGTPHYIQAAIDPILFTILQIKQSGLKLGNTWEAKLAAFAKFYLGLLTPPSVRFENNRKLVSFGDGSEESAATFGLLSTILKDYDPLLSKQLLAVFHKGPARTSFASPIMLAVDLASTVSEQPPNLTTASYEGYISSFRSAVNTKMETVLWALNGDGYFDHRNDDAGEIALYALGAPLSLSRSSFYYPAATDARIRSMVVPEKLFPEWLQSDQPINGRSLTNRTWNTSSLVGFTNLGQVASATIQMQAVEKKQWYRTVTSIFIKEDKPIFIFKDSVTGSDNNIWSMLMMSEGPVNTPAGAITPDRRINNFKDLRQLPSATAVQSIKAGWNRFGFTGQVWKSHFTNGINWSLYTYQPKSINFTLAHWGTTWQNHFEEEEFKKSNGRPYSEEQQIIRLRANNIFYAVLIPYLKGDEAYEKSIILYPGKKMTLKQDESDIMIIDGAVLISKPEGEMLVNMNRTKLVGRVFSCSGGALLINQQRKQVIVRVHGATGQRTINTSLNLKPQVDYKNVKLNRGKDGTSITIEYNNENNNLPIGEKGFREYIFLVVE